MSINLQCISFYHYAMYKKEEFWFWSSQRFSFHLIKSIIYAEHNFCNFSTQNYVKQDIFQEKWNEKKICIYFVLVHSSGEDRERESVCILLNYFVLFYVVWSIFRLNSNYGEREFMRRISKKKKMNKF